MRCWRVVAVILLSFVSNCKSDDFRNEECPPWFIYNEAGCECGSSLGGIVQCEPNSNQTLLQIDHCMTYELSTSTTVVGYCPFGGSVKQSNVVNERQIALPKNLSLVNQFMCGRLSRTGLLCSQCNNSLGTAVLSNDLQCLECVSSPYGWLLYIFLAVFPTTIFFIIVISFQIQVTSAPLNIFICTSQMVSCSVNWVPQFGLLTSPDASIFGKILVSLYGIWNLDYFRYFLPSFCISNKLKIIHLLSLEYFVAFYPLILIALTYTCIELHARDCKVLVCMWRPFNICFTRLRRRWDPRATIIHAFATFLFLSYSKLLFVSINFFISTQLYDVHGAQLGPKRLYWDATVQYFSNEHLSIVILATFLYFLFLYYSHPCFFACTQFVSSKGVSLDADSDGMRFMHLQRPSMVVLRMGHMAH